MLHRKLCACMYPGDTTDYYPSVDLRFTAGQPLPAGITFSRASHGTTVVGGTVTDFANDIPRIGDYGLVIESASQNWIRNPRWEGAVVGTPGTLPTNTSVITAGGLTTSVVATGTEAGLPYIDLRFSGTTSGTTYRIAFEGQNIIQFVPPARSVISTCWKLIAGSFTNITALNFGYQTYNVGNGTVSNGENYHTLPVAGGSILDQRAATVGSCAGATTYGRPQLSFTYTAGNAVDVTIRFAGMMYEFNVANVSGPASTIMLPPAGTPGFTSKAADVIGIPFSLLNFNPAEYTIEVEGFVQLVASALPTNNMRWFWLYNSADGGATNNIIVPTRTNTGDMWNSYNPSGVGVLVPGNIAPGNFFKNAFAGKMNYTCAVLNGGTPVFGAPTDSNYPVGLDSAGIGVNTNYAAPLYTSAFISRIAIYNECLSPSQMQRITS